MRPIGFSTGAVALDDFPRAMEMLRGKGFTAVELSALREAELSPLIAALDSLHLDEFDYVALHAPSRLDQWDETQLVRQLAAVAERGYPIILHPDVIRDSHLWTGFGSLVCIENMDKRKAKGRNVAELAEVFDRLPEASFCFDLGHARQVDPTMSLAIEILEAFGTRLRQLHVSEVNARSKHEPLNRGTVHAFARIAHLIPEITPVILESPVTEGSLLLEAEEARIALDPRAVVA